jgi:hypothetical protein
MANESKNGRQNVFSATNALDAQKILKQGVGSEQQSVSAPEQPTKVATAPVSEIKADVNKYRITVSSAAQYNGVMTRFPEGKIVSEIDYGAGFIAWLRQSKVPIELVAE